MQLFCDKSIPPEVPGGARPEACSRGHALCRRLAAQCRCNREIAPLPTSAPRMDRWAAASRAMRVMQQPTDPSAAQTLAREQFLYCSDIVQQAVGTTRALASMLQGARRLVLLVGLIYRRIAAFNQDARRIPPKQKPPMHADESDAH